MAQFFRHTDEIESGFGWFTSHVAYLPPACEIRRLEFSLLSMNRAKVGTL